MIIILKYNISRPTIKDIKIMHQNNQDRMAFFGTIFEKLLVPLAVFSHISVWKLFFFFYNILMKSISFIHLRLKEYVQYEVKMK